MLSSTMVGFLTALAASLGLAEAAVKVRKTNRGPTGYEVTITYANTSVENVQIGALPHFTDQYRTTSPTPRSSILITTSPETS